MSRIGNRLFRQKLTTVLRVGDQSTWGPSGVVDQSCSRTLRLELGARVPRDQLRQLPVQSDPPTHSTCLVALSAPPGT